MDEVRVLEVRLPSTKAAVEVVRVFDFVLLVDVRVADFVLVRVGVLVLVLVWKRAEL